MNVTAVQWSRQSKMDDTLNSQIQLLRSRVEADLAKPAVVMVTSALPGDGKTMTAHSLAVSFGQSGHRVALAGSPVTAAQRGVTFVGIPSEDGRITERERLVAFIESSRAAYDYTVVDAGTFLRSNTAMALAALVDGILVTVRVGRAPSDDDELLVRTIEHSRDASSGWSQPTARRSPSSNADTPSNGRPPRALRRPHGLTPPSVLQLVAPLGVRPDAELVTGGAGFLGSHLVNSLVDGGERAIIIDNLSTGHVRNLEHALSTGRATFVFADVAVPPPALFEIVGNATKARIDRIYHLASPPARGLRRRPMGNAVRQRIGTMSLIEVALQHGARMLYSSTSEVYGDPLVTRSPRVTSATSNPIGPRSCYDEGKRFGEAAIAAAFRAVASMRGWFAYLTVTDRG